VSGQSARRRTALKRTVKSCGPDASEVGVKSCGGARAQPGGRANIRKATVPKKPDRRGEHDISRKPLRAGMPGDFRCDRCEYSCAVCTTHFAHEAAGALGARHSPRPLSFGRNRHAPLGRIAPRDRETVSRVGCLKDAIRGSSLASTRHTKTVVPALSRDP
jgi:hypothetical protein